MKRKKQVPCKITIVDYLRAIKKVDREIQLEQSPGWARITKVHKSKKLYSRKNNKNDYSND